MSNYKESLFFPGYLIAKPTLGGEEGPFHVSLLTSACFLRILESFYSSLFVS